MVPLTAYNIMQIRDLDDIKDIPQKPASNNNSRLVEPRKLDSDLKEMSISYNDDERRICSAFFKMFDPKLRLSVID